MNLTTDVCLGQYLLVLLCHLGGVVDRERVGLLADALDGGLGGLSDVRLALSLEERLLRFHACCILALAFK